MCMNASVYTARKLMIGFFFFRAVPAQIRSYSGNSLLTGSRVISRKNMCPNSGNYMCCGIQVFAPKSDLSFYYGRCLLPSSYSTCRLFLQVFLELWAAPSYLLLPFHFRVPLFLHCSAYSTFPIHFMYCAVTVLFLFFSYSWHETYCFQRYFDFHLFSSSILLVFSSVQRPFRLIL